MITNLSSFIKPVDPGENSLKGVVTPYDQKFNRKEEAGFSLMEIVNDESLYARFAKNTFPDIQIMENGEVFMDPTKRVIQTLHEYYIKWMILDENFIPSHDHDYPYVNIPKTGYLMKLVIPRLSEIPFDNDFTVEYVCDINNIQTRMSDSIHNIQSLKDQNAINVDTKEDLTIDGFDPSRYPKIYELLLNKREFFNNYLNSIFE